MIWIKYKSGFIWGHRGQKVIFSKNATSATEYMVLSALCNIVYPCYHGTHKYALTWDSKLHSLVSSSFFLLSQFSAYNSNMPEPILTILGHNNPLQYRYMSHDQHGVKGHVGVTGVKKVIFH